MENLVVTMPAFNEAKTIGRVLEEIHKAVPHATLLVVDDGSTDSTASIAKKAGAIVYSHPRNMGLASAFRSEVKKCLELNAEVIVHTDADGQYSAREIHALLEKIKEGNDLVLGSRFLGKIEHMPWLNRTGNKLFSDVVSRVAGVPVTDAQTGFRAFTRKIAEEVQVRSSHTYTQEQVIRASLQHFRIAEVPCTFLKRQGGKSRLIRHPIEYAVKAWINILRIYRDYEPLKFFGTIGLAFFTPGFMIGLWLVYLFLTRGYIGHLPSALLAVLLMSFGIQFIFFAFMADMLNNG